MRLQHGQTKKPIERGKKKERRRLHSLFQNRRQRGKEKQAKGEVRRVPVRKDEKRGGGGGGDEEFKS